jgi:hypothetical protein
MHKVHSGLCRVLLSRIDTLFTSFVLSDTFENSNAFTLLNAKLDGSPAWRRLHRPEHTTCFFHLNFGQPSGLFLVFVLGCLGGWRCLTAWVV